MHPIVQESRHVIRIHNVGGRRKLPIWRPVYVGFFLCRHNLKLIFALMQSQISLGLEGREMKINRRITLEWLAKRVVGIKINV
jgi:hypothetical protein